MKFTIKHEYTPEEISTIHTSIQLFLKFTHDIASTVLSNNHEEKKQAQAQAGLDKELELDSLLNVCLMNIESKVEQLSIKLSELKNQFKEDSHQFDEDSDEDED